MKLCDGPPRALLCGACLALGLLVAGNVGAQQLKLAGQHFDPLEALPADTLSPRLPAEKLAAPAPDRLYYIVQFDGPIEEDWKTTLRSSGAQVFDYIPDFAFIVKLRPEEEEVIRGLPNVRWLGEYRPMYRVSQAVADAQLTGVDREGRDVAQAARLRVILFPGEDVEAIESGIVALGGSVRDRVTTKWKTTLAVDMPTSRIPELAAMNGVKWVETEPVWRLFNNKATDIMGVRVPRDAHGLYGEGQTVGVADTGLDQGSASAGSLHDDFEDGSGSSRVVQIFDVAGDGAADVNSGHGTHVAGSVLGNGVNSGSNPLTSSFPNTCFAGIAPKAHLVMQATENNTTGGLVLPVDLNTLFAQSEGAGADLHTNSWGSDGASAYTSNSAEVDQYMWDHKDFLILFSAGNSGGDLDGDGVIDPYSIGAPASAKNCLTVGASENERPSGEGADINWGSGWYEFPADPIYSDHVSDQPWGMAAFSSRGPVLDGRYKPDIVAPGTNILSTRSSLAAGSGWGSFDSYYFYMGGTSMATPLTAGAAALLREYLIGAAGIASPSAALLKAALLNSAEDIAPGQYGTGATLEIPATPNDVAGWGRVNLSYGVFPAAPYVIQYRDRTTGLSTGGYENFNVTLVGSAWPLKITLAWTDYPGSAAVQGGLVNDLDLQVTDPSAIVHYADGAVQMSSVSTLQYDSGASNSVSSTARRAMRMTPASHPVSLESTTFYFFNNGTTADVDVVVYDDDGAGGTPGSELFRKTLTYVPSGFTTVGINGVIVTSGDVYVALELGSPNHYLYVDNGNPTGRSYFFNGADWVVSGFTAFIRANVRGSAYSTAFDRVNNVVGLRLPSPATGTYTIRVSGYNVPYGPQPYALVVSGEIAHTLTVSKNGTGGGTVTSSPAGISCGADCSEDYAGGTMVTLTATPDATSTFAGWSGAGCSGTGTCVVTMDAAKSVTATFTGTANTLTVSKGGSGDGTVTSSPAGIDCGADCSESFANGTDVTLTASPDATSSFIGWSGEGCSGTGTCVVTMDAAKAVTATFSAAAYTLSVTRAGAGQGTVTSSPAGIDCGGTCAAAFDANSEVTLTAVADAGSSFVGWSGACSSVGAEPCALTMAGAVSVTSYFEPAAASGDTWLTREQLPTARVGAAAASVDGLVYVTGGGNGYDSNSTDVLAFDPADGTWTVKAPMQTSRQYHTAVALDGAIYVMGGLIGWPNSTAAVEMYDPGTDTWTSKAPMQTGRWSFAAAASGGKIYAFGGNYSMSSVEEYDPATDSWTYRASLTTVRRMAAAATIDGLIYVVGGCLDACQEGDGYLETVEAFDPETNTWSARAPLRTGRTGLAAVAFEGHLYAYGGNAGTGFQAGSYHPRTVEQYDPVTDSWRLRTPLSVGRIYAASAEAGGRLYLMGGIDDFDGNLAARTANEEYTPPGRHELDVSKAGTGSGTVSSNPARIDCGTRCSAWYDAEVTVTLAATPDATSTFTGWSGAGCSGTGTCVVTMNAAKSVTATFTRNSYTLSVSKDGTGDGTVTSSPTGIDCGADCSEDYPGTTEVTLTATPDATSTFTGWSGAGCSGMGTCVVTMDAAEAVTATFTSTCTYSIDPTSESYTPSGGYGTVAVTSASGCGWTAVSNDAWITVTSGSVGSGDGSVGYSVAANTGPARTGTVSIAGQTLTVNQSSGCTFTIDPTSASYDFSGGSGSVSVTAGSGCGWTAVSNDAWITVTSGSSGSGSGSVGYSVAAGSARTGTITIAGQTFTVAQSALFTDIGAGLMGVSSGSMAWGDYDNDGDLDILLTGSTGSSPYVAKVYRNDGGVFTDIGAALTGVYASSVAWGDYDNDGDLDILLAGCGYISKVYRNDGGGVFTDIGAGLTGVCSSSVAWGDYDNDGDLDILLTGWTGNGAVSKVYRNDGREAFTDIGAGLPGVFWGSVAWGDYDNDGDLDILLTGDPGSPPSPPYVTEVYRNDGGGVFTDISAGLPGVASGSVAWGDYDNDGDLDILLTGLSDFGLVSTVYRNEGGGVFTDIGAGLPGSYGGSVAWGDYDNDGDLDILLTSTGVNSIPFSKLYRNDGGGIFTDISTALTAVRWGSAAWGDYDNDGDLDILLMGNDGSIPVAQVYRNNVPSANSVPVAPTSLGTVVNGGQVVLSWAAASDSQTPAGGLTYNLRMGTSPGADDILSPMAAGGGYRRIPALGNAQHGTTAALLTLPGPGIYYWSVQAVDTALAGSPFALEKTFTVCGYSIDPTSQSMGSAGGASSVAVTAPAGCAWTAVSNEAWITVTSGSSGSGNGSVGYSVAVNPGPARTGTLTIAGQTFTVNQSPACTYSIDPTSASYAPTVGAGDVSVTAGSGCGWTAVSNAAWITVTSGASGSGTGSVGYSVAANTGAARTGTLTIAGHTITITQAGLFTVIAAELTAVSWSSVAWGDYDNDGDLDILLTGTSASGPVTKVYRNDSEGVFTDISAELMAVSGGAVAWGDYDNDGDLDILLEGLTGAGFFSKVYRNDGEGMFTDINAGLTGIAGGAVAWGDYDNDGDLDILLTGSTTSGLVAKVYRNDGGAMFTDIDAGLTGVGNDSSVAWGDYDNDGDLDILLSGLSRVYRNDGGGVFTDISAGLTGVNASSMAWGDFDNDGDLDILLTGYSSFGRVSTVYRNDGGGLFTDIDAGLTAVGDSSVAWGDYDNDGNLDILLAGWRTGGTYVTELYRNNGGSAFTNVGAPLTGVRWGSVAWGDYDDDGDLDVLLTGDDGSGYTAIYRNDGATTNTAPGAPASLSAAVNGGQVELSWSAANDSMTHPDGLTYNLRVGTSPGASDVVSPMAAGSGYRRIPALGNAQHGTTAVLTPPGSPGTYYWSVQAVDTAFAGSPFALEKTFTVCGYSIDPTSQSIGPAGGASSVAVTAPAGCAWTAVSNDAWITVTSGSSGSGNGSVGYSVAANTGPARTGTVTIGGQTFTVNQSSGCAYAIDPTSASYDLSGGSGSVSVAAGSGCGWTSVSNAAWITVTSGSGGSGIGSVGYSVAANTGPPRTGTVAIAGQTFTVNQEGCSYSIDPTSAGYDQSGGSGSVSVTAGSGCGWTAVSNAAWITVTSGASGSGNGSVGYSVAASTGPPRTGAVTIAGHTHTVVQPADIFTDGFESGDTSAWVKIP